MIDSSVGGQPTERSATERVAERSGHGPAGGRPPAPGSEPIVAIVGAGIAGLVVAHRLAAMGVPTAIVDAAPRPGGRITTRRQDGLVLEAGPDGFLAGPAVLALCRELGLEGELVEPLPPAATSILWRGRLHPLPPGTAAGVPVALRGFWPTALLRPWEKARVLLDLVLPGEGDALALDDPLGPALRRRLGRAVVERLVEPLLGGLHGGGLDDLSGGAVAPWLVDVLRRGSLVRGLRRRHGAAPMRLLSLHGGMERLVEELARGLEGRAKWHLGRGAEGVARGPEGWRIVLEDGSSLEAAGLVLACPAPAAGRLVEGVDGELARLLGTIAYGSLAVVNLAYREADLGRAPEGHGFLVPRAEPGRLRGVSWASRKWPGRAPPASSWRGRSSTSSPDRNPRARPSPRRPSRASSRSSHRGGCPSWSRFTASPARCPATPSVTSDGWRPSRPGGAGCRGSSSSARPIAAPASGSSWRPPRRSLGRPGRLWAPESAPRPRLGLGSSSARTALELGSTSARARLEPRSNSGVSGRRDSSILSGVPTLRPPGPLRRSSRRPARAAPPRILVIGDLVLDAVLVPSRPLERGTDVPGRVALRQGGSAANTARWLARLGARTTLVAAVGRDRIGRALVETIRAEGVTPRVARIAGHRSGRIGVLVTPDGERSFVADRGAADQLAPSHLRPAWFRGIDLLHLPAYSLLGEPLGLAGRAAIEAARAENALVSLDLASIAPLLARGRRAARALVAWVRADILFATEAESEALLGRYAVDDLLEFAPLAIVKRGAEGRDGPPSKLRGRLGALEVRGRHPAGDDGGLDGRRRRLRCRLPRRLAGCSGGRAAGGLVAPEGGRGRAPDGDPAPDVGPARARPRLSVVSS
ncbi:MAG: hypothetical protein KatS3mg065_0107 [Chloroflexota bacterium]|nr:MAG: hypothetical protein KatS3mg065_0107 [Chloroflexota bacterium]